VKAIYWVAATPVARRDWWLTLLKDVQPQTETIAALAVRPVEQVMRAPDAVAVKQLVALHRERQIEAMLLEHLDKKLWVKLLDRAQAAATQGESSFELIRFPYKLCSDGGRKIDVAEN
jgi:hypothetical protein